MDTMARDDLLEIWLLNLCDTSNASKDEIPDIFDAVFRIVEQPKTIRNIQA